MEPGMSDGLQSINKRSKVALTLALVLGLAQYAAAQNACASNPCQNDGECVEFEDGRGATYMCKCSPFWTGVNCEMDVDECLVDNGGCGEAVYYHCVNLPGAPVACLAIGGGQINSDPHFEGFLGQHFDVTGKPDTVYALISDTGFAVNARFAQAWATGLYSDPVTLETFNMRPYKTWISEVGVVVGSHSVVMSTARSPLSPLCRDRVTYCALGGSLKIDGKNHIKLGSLNVDNDVQVTLKNSASYARVNVAFARADINIDYVKPPKEWNVDAKVEAKFAHLNLQIIRIELSQNAAGILGATSRTKLDSEGQPIMKSEQENGEGIIDGVIEDYEMSSITSTDFKFSQFLAPNSDEEPTVTFNAQAE